MSRGDRFRKRLSGPPILADGAMGTELYSRGVYINRCYDELNESQPDLVASVHADYLKAGAELVETNTFGANRLKLTPHGQAEQVARLNILGAQIARQAVERAGGEAFVAGSIGPLGRRLAPIGRLKISEAREAFREQAEGLIAGGVDLIAIETMVDPNELMEAVNAVREISDLPILAQFTLSDYNETAYGATLEGIVTLLSDLQIDVLGINCSIGPNKLLEAAKRLLELTSLPVSVQPNAGELELVEGRMICRATPEYFAEYARRMVLGGVKIVGGCCGSTPLHIRAMDSAIRAVAPELSRVKGTVMVSAPRTPRPEAVQIPYRNLSPMAAALTDHRFIFSVEINPPRSPSVKKTLERVAELKAAGVDLVNVPDGPRASARLSAMILAHAIQGQAGMETILHYTCRDRNILGIQSDLLGAEALDINNILCVTGDPPKLGDYPMATAVYDVDAIGLLRIADNLNHSLDLAGNPIPAGTTFNLGCGANPGAVDLALEVERIHRKLENGARYVMTQPVFDEERFFNIIDRVDRPDIPFLVGILPLTSYRNAEFYHNEVPGMEVPDAIRERLRRIEDGETAARVGVEIAAEALLKCAPRAAGAYIMPPFGKIELALAVIDLFRKSGYAGEGSASQMGAATSDHAS